MNLHLSALPHTWLIDLDGTVVQHNGHKSGGERLLAGVKEFWGQIPAHDTIVLLSARAEDEAAASLRFLQTMGLRYDQVLFGLPAGERVLVNDTKPGGLSTAVALNVKRDQGLRDCVIHIDAAL